MNPIVLVNVGNLYRSVLGKYASRLDYTKLISNLEVYLGYQLSVRIAYGSQDPQTARNFIQFLKSLGFTTKFKKGYDSNVLMTINALELAFQGQVVILATNDKAIVPLVETLQNKGVRPIILGCEIPQVLSNITECIEVGEDYLFLETGANFENTEPTE